MTPTFLKVADLIERGWTKTLIQRFLGPPDQIEEHRIRYVGAYKVYLFHADRVAAVESRQEVRLALTKVLARRPIARQAAAKAVATKTAALIKEVTSPPTIDLTGYSHERLQREARGRYDDRGRPFSANPVDYVRHCLTDYEERLSMLRGRVGGGAPSEDPSPAYQALRDLYDGAIDWAMAALPLTDAEATHSSALAKPEAA